MIPLIISIGNRIYDLCILIIASVHLIIFIVNILQLVWLCQTLFSTDDESPILQTDYYFKYNVHINAITAGPG